MSRRIDKKPSLRQTHATYIYYVYIFCGFPYGQGGSSRAKAYARRLLPLTLTKAIFATNKQCKNMGDDNLSISFFIPMLPPTITHQEKQVRVVNGKPIFYEPQELKAARAKLAAHLAKYAPAHKFTGPIRLVTKWCFPRGKHKNGEYKATKPDTDNLQKLLKDVMTDLGYWKDDALVASEIIEKFWAEIPGIYISISELDGGMCRNENSAQS